MDLEAARKALCRRAIVLDIGGFRPPDDPLASWFGRVTLAAEGEGWPTLPPTVDYPYREDASTRRSRAATPATITAVMQIEATNTYSAMTMS